MPLITSALMSDSYSPDLQKSTESGMLPYLDYLPWFYNLDVILNALYIDCIGRDPKHGTFLREDRLLSLSVYYTN